MSTVEFRHARADEPPGSELIAAMLAHLDALYARGPADPPRLSADPHELEPPGGAFLIGWLGTEPVASGGVKRLDATTAEIKRMYVAPAHRSRGYARVLLTALEDAARALGYERTRLDIGPAQPHGLALYRSAGYEEIGDYNGNRYAAWWGEKRLPAGQ